MCSVAFGSVVGFKQFKLSQSLWKILVIFWVNSLIGFLFFFANSVFNGAFVTLGIYSYLFYSKGLKNVTYTLFLCSLIILGYIIFLEIGPEPWKSIQSLTFHATYQKVAVLSLIGTVWVMSKGTDLLDDKI